VARIDGEPVAFGGTWERWKPGGEELQTFATITTDANRQLSDIQDRMPVIIERQDWPISLGEIEASLLHAAPGCLMPMARGQSGRQREALSSSSRPMLPNARFRRVCDRPPPEAGPREALIARKPMLPAGSRSPDEILLTIGMRPWTQQAQH
jgi:hypothetical protein